MTPSADHLIGAHVLRRAEALSGPLGAVVSRVGERLSVCSLATMRRAET